MAPPDTFVAEVDTLCRSDFGHEAFAGMSVTAADVRGDEVALLVYTADTGAGAVCWRGLAGASPNLMSSWDAVGDGEPGDRGARQLCLWLNKGDNNSAHAVAGRYGDDIASVVIERTVRGRVEATSVGGWFLAWWPGQEQGPTRFGILGLDGNGQHVTDLVAARDAQGEHCPARLTSPRSPAIARPTVLDGRIGESG